MKEISNLLINVGTIMLLPYLFNQFKDISEMLRTKSTKFVYGYLAVGLLIVLVGVVVEQLAT